MPTNTLSNTQKDVYDWLHSLEVPHHYNSFLEHGFTDLEKSCGFIRAKDLDLLGIFDPQERFVILQAVSVLKSRFSLKSSSSVRRSTSGYTNSNKNEVTSQNSTPNKKLLLLDNKTENSCCTCAIIVDSNFASVGCTCAVKRTPSSANEKRELSWIAAATNNVNEQGLHSNSNGEKFQRSAKVNNSKFANFGCNNENNGNNKHFVTSTSAVSSCEDQCDCQFGNERDSGYFANNRSNNSSVEEETTSCVGEPFYESVDIREINKVSSKKHWEDDNGTTNRGSKSNRRLLKTQLRDQVAQDGISISRVSSLNIIEQL